MDWKHMRMAKGGGSLAFIVDNTVFKVRKFHKHDNSEKKFTYEKMITDAVAPVLSVQVPHIELIQAGEYLFYKKFLHCIDTEFSVCYNKNQRVKF